MKEKTTREIISMIYDDCIETILVGIDEYKTDFPYTIACSNFIVELKSKNTVIKFNEIFKDEVKDKMLDEIIKYLER